MKVKNGENMKKQTSFFLKYLPMRVSLVSMATAKLPAYLGSALRGVIGKALYEEKEAYNYLYRNHVLSDGQKDIVNPYMVIPVGGEETIYQKGDELFFTIILFGEAIRYVELLINALQKIETLGLGALRYPFVLKQVLHSQEQRVIWQKGYFHPIAVRSVELPYRELADVSRVAVHVCTPLRIRRSGKLIETIDFPTIIRNITRRIEAVTTRYGGWIDTQEAARIQRLAEEIEIAYEQLTLKSMERYSNRLKEKMDFSGLLGSIEFEGELTPFVPWLYAAQSIHIGRNTTFGMGGVRVEFM